MIRRRFLTVALSGAGAWWAAARGAVGASGMDPRFPASVSASVGGKPVRLTLTGTALRTKFRFRVYAIGSYVQEGVRVRDPEGLAAVSAPKLLHMIFERDVDGATLAKSFRQSIGASYPAPAFSDELARLERYFVANPVKQGDHIRLTHVPGVGMGVQVNSRPEVVISGVEFAHAAWGTYFGPNHLGTALKESLTSRIR